VNGYERFLKTVRREEPDKVPIWELIIDRPVIEALYGNIPFLDFIEKEGLDGFTIFEDGKKELLSGITYKDEWNIIWKLEPNNIYYPFDGPIKTYDDLKKFSLPDADAGYLYQSLEEAVKETIAKASPGGGHIMASSNSIHPGVKPENYKIMVEATRKYGKYPIDENLVKEYKTKNYIKDYY